MDCRTEKYRLQWGISTKGSQTLFLLAQYLSCQQLLAEKHNLIQIIMIIYTIEKRSNYFIMFQNSFINILFMFPDNQGQPQHPLDLPLAKCCQFIVIGSVQVCQSHAGVGFLRPDSCPSQSHLLFRPSLRVMPQGQSSGFDMYPRCQRSGAHCCHPPLANALKRVQRLNQQLNYLHSCSFCFQVVNYKFYSFIINLCLRLSLNHTGEYPPSHSYLSTSISIFCKMKFENVEQLHEKIKKEVIAIDQHLLALDNHYRASPGNPYLPHVKLYQKQLQASELQRYKLENNFQNPKAIVKNEQWPKDSMFYKEEFPMGYRDKEEVKREMDAMIKMKMELLEKREAEERKRLEEESIRVVRQLEEMELKQNRQEEEKEEAPKTQSKKKSKQKSVQASKNESRVETENPEVPEKKEAEVKVSQGKKKKKLQGKKISKQSILLQKKKSLKSSIVNQRPSSSTLASATPLSSSNHSSNSPSTPVTKIVQKAPIAKKIITQKKSSKPVLLKTTERSLVLAQRKQIEQEKTQPKSSESIKKGHKKGVSPKSKHIKKLRKISIAKPLQNPIAKTTQKTVTSPKVVAKQSPHILTLSIEKDPKKKCLKVQPKLNIIKNAQAAKKKLQKNLKKNPTPQTIVLKKNLIRESPSQSPRHKACSSQDSWGTTIEESKGPKAKKTKAIAKKGKGEKLVKGKAKKK